jgi:hypothetical protein
LNATAMNLMKMGRYFKMKTSSISIKIDNDILEAIRQRSSKSYRSIAKEINYLLSIAIKAESEAK